MGVARPVVRRGARLALVVAVATLGAACTAPADTRDEDKSNAATGTSSAPGGGDPSVTYAVHAVDPPGDFDGRVYGDDMLLVSTETIPEELVDQILDIRIAGQRAVTAAEPISVQEFSVENRNYRIAAVDPAEYRRFTVPGSDLAAFEASWDRVAGGEIAVRPELKGRLSLDKLGYLAVGSGEETDPIHVGAWASQVGTIDAAVNKEWGEALGLVEDNAIVIYTGGISPQALRKKLKAIVGDISMTDLDIVAEAGIDPNTFQTAVLVGTFSEAVGVFRYTPIGGGRVQPDPAWVRSHIVTETVPILGELTCNKYMMPQLKAALAEVQRRGLADEIKYHVGCYYPRFIAGSTTLSNHSFGLAIDINSLENQRGTVGEMHPEVVAIFKYWGFAWGGDWNYTDPMHFELEQIKTPG